MKGDPEKVSLNTLDLPSSLSDATIIHSYV